MKLRALSAVLLLVASSGATGTRWVFDAGNPGPIGEFGRDLSFTVIGVDQPIRHATLELRLDYSEARELRINLSDEIGAVKLPIAANPSIPAGVELDGVYRFDDRSRLTWADLVYKDTAVSTGAAARAAQIGVGGGSCFNHLARWFNHDLEAPNGTVLLQLRRAAGAGSGAILGARLILDSGAGEQLFANGFEDALVASHPCRRPPFDLVFNGGDDQSFRSPLSTLHLDAGNERNWSARQHAPFLDFGPFPIGDFQSRPYAGRFGGRSRMNRGAWTPAGGILSFDTGVGVRTAQLKGDWAGVTHRVIPGDYDGDGITDLAIAYVGANARWRARILFSTNDAERDFAIDPRTLRPDLFSSAEIAFGAGQDADLDGADEVTAYARMSTSSNEMAAVRIDLHATEASAQPTLVATPWGLVGDRMVLGKWIAATTGADQLGVMVVRFSNGNWQWLRAGAPNAVAFGVLNDYPICADIDGDGLNDLAVFRPGDRRWHVILSGNQQQTSFGPFGDTNAEPLGFVQGTVAP